MGARAVSTRRESRYTLASKGMAPAGNTRLSTSTASNVFYCARLCQVSIVSMAAWTPWLTSRLCAVARVHGVRLRCLVAGVHAQLPALRRGRRARGRRDRRRVVRQCRLLTQKATHPTHDARLLIAPCHLMHSTVTVGEEGEFSLAARHSTLISFSTRL